LQWLIGIVMNALFANEAKLFLLAPEPHEK
jgi:hypothetical protein